MPLPIKREGHQIDIRGALGRVAEALIHAGWEIEREHKKIRRGDTKTTLFVAMEDVDQALSNLTQGEIMGHRDVVTIETRRNTVMLKVVD